MVVVEAGLEMARGNRYEDMGEEALTNVFIVEEGGKALASTPAPLVTCLPRKGLASMLSKILVVKPGLVGIRVKGDGSGLDCY